MFSSKVLLLFYLIASTAFIGNAKYVPLPEPYTDHCILDDNTNYYDPVNQFDVPWFEIDLDKDPYHRWDEIASIYADNINGLLGVIKGLIIPLFPDALTVVDTLFADVGNALPTPYRQEIQGISDVSGIPIGQIVLYNVFYEIFTVCTSVVATDSNGHMYHARNLDFGLFLGWNASTHDWEVSEHLRNMVVNINWVQNGKLVFKSNNFAGYIGIYNGLKPNAFSITANERFMADGGIAGMLGYFLGEDPNGTWMSWLTRETLMKATNYDEAKDMLSNHPMLSPVYYILGGVKPYEGCIIHRSLNQTDLTISMDKTDPSGWFRLQTNYDQNTDVLFLDDRRTPGNACMKKLGQNNVGFKGIFNVLSSRTNLNKLTTYTVLMDVVNSKFETHLQRCDQLHNGKQDCYPF